MCFTIPYKVTRVLDSTAYIEDDRAIPIRDIVVKKGDYVQLTGDVIVGKLSPSQGARVRGMIKELNTSYEYEKS